MAAEPADLGAQPVVPRAGVRRLGGRMRKTIIVALARKLLIALRRYTTSGVVIEGAVMKAAPATIWSRPPEPPAGRGMLGAAQQAATVCELDLVQHAIRSWKRAQTLDSKQRLENSP
jgi:hypothetical protein